MALSFLLDTSVLKRLGQPAVRAVVEPLAAVGQVGRASICDLEVGHSARNGDEWDALVGALAVFVLVDTTSQHVRRALHVQRQLAQRSRRGRKIPHLLIAAAGEQLSLTVLHYDGDFDAIAAVTGQRCEWVVPAGSVPLTEVPVAAPRLVMALLALSAPAVAVRVKLPGSPVVEVRLP